MLRVPALAAISPLFLPDTLERVDRLPEVFRVLRQSV